MKLTVVTAVFNAIGVGNRSALKRCVESVLKLNTEHEHLIYDGSSTDGTVELLRVLESETPGLKVVSEPDTGIYNALNKGVRDAKGEWLYVLGCDDFISNPMALDAIMAEPRPDDEMIVAPVEASDGNATAKFRLQSIHNILSSTPYCHQGVLVKTSIMRRCGGFDERFRLCADYDFMLKAHLNALKIRFVKTPFATYGVEGVSSTSRLEDEYRAVLSERFEFDVTDAIYRSCRFPFGIIRHYLWHGDACIRAAAWRMMFLKLKMAIRSVLYPLVVATRSVRYRGRA